MFWKRGEGSDNTDDGDSSTTESASDDIEAAAESPRAARSSGQDHQASDLLVTEDQGVLPPYEQPPCSPYGTLTSESRGEPVNAEGGSCEDRSMV